MIQHEPINYTGDKVYLKHGVRKYYHSKTNKSLNQLNQPNALTSIKIAHSNINSIRNKTDQIGTELSDYDILCFSETKLNDTVPSSKLEIDGYKTPIRKDRDINNGGGLMIYLKHNIFSKRRSDLENNSIECVWLEIRSLKSKFLLGLFYRPPNSSIEFWNHFENSLESASEQNMDMIVLGDFNEDILSPVSSNHLTRTMLKFNLAHVINEPTRITPTSATCLDLIMTNHSSIINDSQVLPPFNSDHSTITTEVNFKTYKSLTYKKNIWKFEEANITAIENELNQTDWSFILNGDNMNEIANQFEEVILSTAQKFIPKVTFTKRPNDKPWMTNEIRKCMRQRNRLYNKAKRTRQTSHWQKYKDKRNEIVDIIREAKSDYNKKLEEKIADPNLSPKDWYRLVNDITKLKNKHNPQPPLCKNNQVHIHPIDKAQTLNEHFASISKIENEPQIPAQPIDTEFSLSSIHVTNQDVKDQLHLLNSSKPGGPDDISPKLLKLISSCIHYPLTLLFNRSLELGQVPYQWKMGNISAIFKGKGDDQDPTNYRPISVTSCLGKILEKIIFKYLFNYLEENKILTNYQSGFRPRDSTVNQLLELYQIIVENLDKGLELKFIFCDISKAFDKVWHQGLLHKLRNYGINGNIYNWFTSYLLDRKQRVISEGFSSTWLPTCAGVPQGSVLGPYLFLLYINDVVNNIDTNVRLFADDTSLFTVIENANSIQALQEDLYKIAKWSEDWCIILNPSKTTSMTFTRKRNSQPLDVKFDDQTLKDVKHHTHLGLTLTSDASWDEHIKRTYSKAAYRLNILRMLKYDLDRKSLLRFYTSFIRPTLEYGDIVWDNISQQNQTLLENVQLDACRIITGLRKGTSHSILYNELGLCPLAERRKKHKLIQFYKILNNEAPTYLDNILYRFNEQQSQYNLRSEKLKHPTPKTKSYQDSFFISTTNLWNNLSPELNNATSLHSFKNLLKKETTQPPKWFSTGTRKYNIIICQLRNEKSQLNNDLFKDHLKDSPLCTNCNENKHENKQHFFFECTKFTQQRTDMINRLQACPILYSNIVLNAEFLVTGSNTLSEEYNLQLTNIVSNFIKDTQRFDGH